MTPEQKAFFEYGKALGELKGFRSDHWSWCCVNRLDRRHAWRTGDGFDCETQDIVNQHAKLIRDAWKKRAACRAWTPPEGRDCPNCKYHGFLTKQYPCRDCYKHDDQRRWESRKEGE